MRKVDSSKDLPIRGPGLTLVKDLLEVGGSYDDEKGQVIIPGWIRGTIEETPTAIRHELAHALFHAAGGIVHGLPRQDIPAEIRRCAKLDGFRLFCCRPGWSCRFPIVAPYVDDQS